MAAWVREGEKVPDNRALITDNHNHNRQRKREAEAADKVELAHGVIVGSLRRFRATLIGLNEELPKRRRLR